MISQKLDVRQEKYVKYSKEQMYMAQRLKDFEAQERKCQGQRKIDSRGSLYNKNVSDRLRLTQVLQSDRYRERDTSSYLPSIKEKLDRNMYQDKQARYQSLKSLEKNPLNSDSLGMSMSLYQ